MNLTDRERRAIKNRADKDRKKRKKLRDRLEAKGVPEERIEEILEERRRVDRQARYARVLGQRDDVYEYDPEKDEGYYPDDSGYEPSVGDPLLRGAARATGMTAKVVKRRETITDWQYDRATGGSDVEA